MSWNPFKKPKPKNTEVKAPGDILFSLPTINDSVPPESGDSELQEVLNLHEDEWRQFEAVSREYSQAVGKELEAVREVLGAASVPFGNGMRAFKRLHVRSSIGAPIANRVDLAELVELAPGRVIATGLSLSGRPPVLGGFAFRLGERAVYGRSEAENVTVLCLDAPAPAALGLLEATRFADLLDRHELDFVHWPSATVLGREQLLAFLQRK